MKNLIYSAVIAILVLISFAVLLLYYTQSFVAHYDFEKTLTIKDLELQKSDRGGVNYLDYAKAELGTLSLSNEGYFTKIYRTPVLVGCINTKETASDESLRIGNFQFQVTYYGDTQTYAGNTIEIPVGGEKEYKIVGQYNSYDVPVYVFSDSVESISVYEIPKEENNPLGEISYDYYNNYNNYYGDNCNLIKEKLEPLKTIKVSA